MGSLLEQLCILQSVNQFELLTLHALHVSLVLRLLVSFSGKFLFQLLTRAIGPLKLVVLSLLGRLLLLCGNHVFHVASPLLLHGSLLKVTLPNSHFLSLSLQSNLLLLLSCTELALSNGLIGSFFHSAIHLAFHGFLHLLLSQAFLFLLLGHHVALALGHDLVCTLASFVDFLHDL